MLNYGKWALSTAIVTSLSTLGLPGLALAQQAQTAQGQTAILEEITVTAERVSSSLQTTPIAISAFTPESLAARQITNVLQAAAAIPGVMITPTTGGSNSARIHMRGAGQENGGILYDPAVGIYIDNVYMPRINGQFFDFFDIERLEVLRGPQGTLYGRNTNGGAIKLVTKRPSMEFTANAEVGYGAYEMTDAKVFLSGPIVKDKLAVSVSAVSRKRNGLTRADYYGRDVNNMDRQAFRTKFYLAAGDNIDIEFAADYMKDRSDPGVGTPVQTGYVGNLAANGQLDPAAVPGRNLFVTELFGPIISKNDANGLYLNMTWRATPEWTISSITGHRNQRNSAAGPLAYTTQNTAALPVGTSGAFKDKFWTQEINAAYSSERLKGVGGFYYFTETGDSQAGVPYAYSAPNRLHRETDAWAAFAQATFYVVPKLGIVGGLRYTREVAKFSQIYPTIFNTLQVAPNKTYTATTPKIGIEWTPTDDLMVYASFTKGFKSGGYNNVSPSTNVGGPPGSFAGPVPYDPETVKSYEVGAKYTTPDKRLRVNIAVFQADYGGLQLPVFFPGTVNTYTSNASNGRVRGIEIEPTWQVTDALQLFFMGSFSNDKYTSAFNCSLFNTQIVNCGLGGTHVNGNPSHLKGVIPVKTQAGFTFSPELNMPGQLHFTGTWQHNAKYFNNVSNTQDLTQTPKIDTFDASVAWDVNDHWRVAGEVKNLGNKQYALESLQLASAIRASITAYPAEPRMWAIRASYKW